MSYILDALQKADQQRQRGATPTLQSAQTLTALREPRRQWLYPTVAIALAAVAFAIGWLRPWRMEPVAAPAPAVPAPFEPSPRAATPSIPSATILSAGEPRALAGEPAPVAAAQEPAKRISDDPERALPARAPAPEPPAGALPKAAEPTPAKRGSAESGAGAKEDKARDDHVPALAELPASARTELPAMAISVHAYFPTPKDRLVSVNGKLLREGDALTPDLVVEKITPDGVVFSYKGTRFRHGVR
ncbi:MAG: general secretion pathway protein GspB [Burkholderiales bacterium]